MGWGSGRRLFGELVTPINGVVPDAEQRRALYRVMIKAFENKDCDTLCELQGEDVALDRALEDEGVLVDEDDE